MKLFFNDQIHKDELRELLVKYGRVNSKTHKVDRYYLSAFYILTSDSELRRKCLGFINEDGIDFEEMMKRNDFSSGYLVLIKLAFHLFNEEIAVTPIDIIDYLDRQCFIIAMNAILARRFLIKIEELE